MSNSLGIFGNLAGYLTAVATGNKDAASQYYLQKYYSSSGTARDNDVAAAFTDGVVELAKKLREIDISTGAVASLTSVLNTAVSNYVNGLTITVPAADGNITGDVVSAGGTGPEIRGNSINDVGLTTSNYKAALKAAVSSSGLLKPDIDRANSFIDASLGTPSVNGFAVDPAADKQQALKQKLIEDGENGLKTLLAANYDKSAITGSTPLVADILTKLKNGADTTLFDRYMSVMKGDRTVRPSDIDLNNLKDFRINIKTESNTAISTTTKVPVLVNDLPVLQPNNRVRYNGDKVLDSPVPELLKKVFVEVYSTGNAPTSLPSYDLTKMSSGLQPDLERLMRNVLTRKTTPSAHIADDESDKINEAFKKANWRRVGEDTWRTTIDGETVEYNPNKADFGSKLADQVNNCAAIGFAGDANKCRDFLTEIAQGSDSKKLAELATAMDNDVTAEVVAKLHPKYALAILKSFGFRRKLCKDSIAGRQIEKVQRVDEWKKNFVEKKFTADVAASIKGNTRLLTFLDLLAQLVNSNPSILNDSYSGETEESTGTIEVPDELVKRRIVAVESRTSGKPVMSWSTVTDKMGKIYGSFSKGLTFNGTSTNSPFGMDNLFPSMVLPTVASRVVGSTWGSMGGGGGDKVFLAEHETSLEYSHNIVTILGKLTSNLKSLGKTLSEDDINKIEDKLSQFERLERELYETARDIQTYSQLIKVLEAENRKEIITDSHIKKYVEKYNHLLNRYEKTGSSLSTLASLLKDCSDGGDSKGCETDGEL
jgi:hypothetical protein